MKDPSFIIISGTSGSGKTVALKVLEDLGYYCVDNLPASLLPDLAKRANSKPAKTTRYAVSIDSRNQDLNTDLENDFQSLRELNIEYQVLFLDADDKTLLKRFSETRRKHPLSDENTSLSEAISRERKTLKYIVSIADRRINTTDTTPHELRSTMREYGATSQEGTLTLLFESFGFKYGNPNDADFLFDVRCLPNPHWDVKLKPLTGLDAPVQAFFRKQAMCNEMFEKIRDFIDYWLPSFINDNRNYITVAIGCTGGQHRSVFISDRLNQHFSSSDTIHTLVRHRELNL